LIVMSKEIWKTVPSWPELQASSWGRIRTVPRKVPQPSGGFRMAGGKPTYGAWDRYAYKYIWFTKRYNKTFKVARLVCEAFYGVPEEGAVTMHLDENVRNNRPENLAWGTQKQNCNMPRLKQYHRKVCRIKMKGESPPPRLGLS